MALSQKWPFCPFFRCFKVLCAEPICGLTVKISWSPTSNSLTQAHLTSSFDHFYDPSTYVPYIDPCTLHAPMRSLVHGQNGVSRSQKYEPVQSNYFMLLPIPINIVKCHITWGRNTHGYPWRWDLCLAHRRPFSRKTRYKVPKRPKIRWRPNKKLLDERVKRVVWGQMKALG